MTETDRIEPTLDPSAAPVADPEAAQTAAPPAGSKAASSKAASQAPSNKAANEAASPPAPQPTVDAGALAEAHARLAELEAKNKELAEQYLRAQADMQNTRRRAEDEMSKARKFAVESFAESMLPVVDSLEAGLVHKDATAEQVREGAEITLRQLKAALERNKVIEINPQGGAKFDPHQHQAISVVPAPEGSSQEANTIVTVLQKGYLIADRVLRPALVTVTAPK